MVAGRIPDSDPLVVSAGAEFSGPWPRSGRHVVIGFCFGECSGPRFSRCAGDGVNALI